MTRLTIALLAAACFCACRGHAPASMAGPNMNAKREANLLAAASKELKCPTESLKGELLESIERNAHIFRVMGCGGTYDSILSCALGNCAWIETPEKRASFDLQCPQEQLQRTYLGQGTFGMSGCGRAITYIFGNGTWVANNSGPSAPAVPASSQTPVQTY